MKDNETLNCQITTEMTIENKTSQTTEPAIAVKPVLAPVFVYEFLYNSDCCESAAVTISIHKTKKGAEMAMESHKAETQKQWNEMRKLDEENDPEYWKEFEWDFDQWWGVRKCKLLP